MLTTITASRPRTINFLSGRGPALNCFPLDISLDRFFTHGVSDLSNSWPKRSYAFSENVDFAATRSPSPHKLVGANSIVVWVGPSSLQDLWRLRLCEPTDGHRRVPEQHSQIQLSGKSNVSDAKYTSVFWYPCRGCYTP